jgi:hypothetical protein
MGAASLPWSIFGSFTGFLDVCSGRAADGMNASTSQGPINFVRIAYRTSSAVDETPSLRIAEAR